MPVMARGGWADYTVIDEQLDLSPPTLLNFCLLNSVRRPNLFLLQPQIMRAVRLQNQEPSESLLKHTPRLLTTPVLNSPRSSKRHRNPRNDKTQVPHSHLALMRMNEDHRLPRRDTITELPHRRLLITMAHGLRLQHRLCTVTNRERRRHHL
jgi:hypothetical protein